MISLFSTIQHNTYILRGLRSEDYNYSYCFSHNFGFLYNLKSDPDELNNLFENDAFKELRQKIHHKNDRLYAVNQ